MMVIAASSQEQRARVTPDGFVEAERSMIEVLRDLEASDRQMYMAHRRSRRRPFPRDSPTRRNDVRDVECLGCHCHFATVSAPRVPRSIGVDLDPQTVRVPQIQRLTDKMIGSPEAHGTFREMSSESPKRSTIWQKDREVIQTECATAGMRYARACL